MEVFVYECPSCGGKVDYNQSEKKWICSYCKKSFNNLFVKKKENKLPNIDDFGYIIYKHTCVNCDNTIISKHKASIKCTNCDNSKIDSEEMKVISIYRNDSPNANKLYKDKIKDFDTLPEEYINNKFKLNYINCSIIDGFIKVSYSELEYKYMFINLFIPNLDFEDYRFVYEVANHGITTSYINNVGETEIINELSDNFANINTYHNKEYEKDFEKACLEDFKKKNNINETNEIKVESNLTIKDGIYLPVYIKQIKINNETLRQYVISSTKFDNMVINEFPSVDNDNLGNLIKTHKRKGDNLLTINLSIGALLPLIIVLSFLDIRFLILLVACLIIGIPSSYVIEDKAKRHYKIEKYLKNTAKITKDDCYDQLINNTAFVIVDGGKK